MAETPERIKKHIALLSDFEQKYGEFINRTSEREDRTPPDLV
jgi:hypothetical protein